MSRKIIEKKENKKKSTVLPAVLALVLLGLMIVLLSVLTRKRGDNKEPEISLGDYASLEIVLDGIDESLSDDKRLEKVDQAVLDALLSVCSFKHLDKAVKERYNENMKYYAQMVVLYDQYETITDLATKYYDYPDLESFQKSVMDYSELSIKQELALDAVAKEEKLSVDDAVFNRYIGKYLAAYDYSENETDKFLENYGRETVYEIILRDYTLDRLKKMNKVSGSSS